MEITGGCLCGGTRYVLKSRPIALVDCHCIDCRRSAGAPYVQWGSVPRKDLVRQTVSRAKSRMRIGFFRLLLVAAHICFLRTVKSRTRLISRLRRLTIRRRLRRKKRSSSKINCPGLLSTNQSHRFKQSRRRSLTTGGGRTGLVVALPAANLLDLGRQRLVLVFEILASLLTGGLGFLFELSVRCGSSTVHQP